MKPCHVSILGSTGSIGENTLSVIAAHPEKFKVVALSAHRSCEKLLEQCQRFVPDYAVVADPARVAGFRDKIKEQGLSTVVLSGSEGLCMIAELPEVEKVVAAIVGAAGLLSTLSAVKAGKQVLLANKEALVMSGDILLATAKQSKAILLPVDSEHNALFQCMPAGYMTGERPETVSKLILTASGGSFLNFTRSEMEQVTPQMACQHPNWKMGKKITVDCATLMNKGLECIEASQLFQFEPEHIEVLVHPQSVIHSLVEYKDGSCLAQLGCPDMRIPLAYCLAWPERIGSGAKRLSLSEVGKLTFFEPDFTKFPCLGLAMEAMRLKKAAPTVLNASNEVVVNAFLEGLMRFVDIPTIIEKVLNKFHDLSAGSLDEVLLADQCARVEAAKLVANLTQQV
jgi:1-deoxy-D-xylulose-5-phosphate reductoisomerase